MRCRRSICVGLGALAVSAVPVGQASAAEDPHDGAHLAAAGPDRRGGPAVPMLTELRAADIADPVGPGPSREAVLVDLTRWAIESGAVAQSFDPRKAVHHLLFPPGSRVEVPERFARERVRVVASPIGVGRINQTERTVRSFAASRSGRLHSYVMRVDPRNGRIEVGTDAPEAVIAKLRDSLRETAQFRRQSIRLQVGGRSADAVPHWGGARIVAQSGATCTAGPSVRVGQATYGTTASHCGPVGTRWNSGRNHFGRTHLDGGPMGFDTARIAGGGRNAGRIYHGGVGSRTGRAQAGAGDPAGAVTVWTSGARGGSTSGVVTNLSASACTASQCYSGLFTTSNVRTVPGDSGAPVHTLGGSQVGVRGSHTALAPGSAGYVTKWSSIARALRVSILTG